MYFEMEFQFVCVLFFKYRVNTLKSQAAIILILVQSQTFFSNFYVCGQYSRILSSK